MKMSHHASIRSRQRGFKEIDVFLIEYFGIPIKKSGKLIEYQMNQKVAKEIRKALERINHKAILIDETKEKIVTVYNLNDR